MKADQLTVIGGKTFAQEVRRSEQGALTRFKKVMSHVNTGSCDEGDVQSLSHCLPIKETGQCDSLSAPLSVPEKAK